MTLLFYLRAHESPVAGFLISEGTDKGRKRSREFEIVQAGGKPLAVEILNQKIPQFLTPEQEEEDILLQLIEKL